jgi:hypothetical protein
VQTGMSDHAVKLCRASRDPEYTHMDQQKRMSMKLPQNKYKTNKQKTNKTGKLPQYKQKTKKRFPHKLNVITDVNAFPRGGSTVLGARVSMAS